MLSFQQLHNIQFANHFAPVENVVKVAIFIAFDEFFGQLFVVVVIV